MTNAIVKGVIARAQETTGMRLCAVVAASNHVHFLLVPQSAKQLADFMRFVNSNVARKVGSLHGWREKFWSRRYQPIIVSDEEAAQVARLRYCLSHGVKEWLVDRASDWPGVQVVAELCNGQEIVSGGLWRDQTGEYEAKRRAGAKKAPPRDAFVTRETFRLSPLPCWEHLDRREVAENVRLLVKTVEDGYRQQRKADGIPCLGNRRIAAQSPFDRPLTSKKSPAPSCHAASREARSRILDAYRAFVTAYRAAAERLRMGVRDVVFPEGSFPPGLPFVPERRAGPAP
jgi:hypothetical protein